MIKILRMDGPTLDTFDRHKIFGAKVTMLSSASFYSNINCPYSQPCLVYIDCADIQAQREQMEQNKLR